MNPIAHNTLSFEKLQIQLQILNKGNDENLFLGREHFLEDENISKDEKEFSKKWIQDYFGPIPRGVELKKETFVEAQVMDDFSPLDAPVKQRSYTQHKIYSDSEVVADLEEPTFQAPNFSDFDEPSAEEEKEPAKPFNEAYSELDGKEKTIVPFALNAQIICNDEICQGRIYNDLVSADPTKILLWEGKGDSTTCTYPSSKFTIVPPKLDVERALLKGTEVPKSQEFKPYKLMPKVEPVTAGFQSDKKTFPSRIYILSLIHI